MNEQKKKLNSRRDIIISVSLALIMAVLLSSPKRYCEAFLQGLKLWSISVLPCLFPYFFLTKLLCSLGSVKRLSNKLSFVSKKLLNAPPITSIIAIMSFLSGYPVGAKMLADSVENRLITTNEAEKISILTSTSGVAFIVGTMGGIVNGSAKMGVIMYAVHVLSAVIMGVFMGMKESSGMSQSVNSGNPSVSSGADILSEAMYNSIISILAVGGFISLFYIVVEMITSSEIVHNILINADNHFAVLGMGSNVASSILRGVLEATQGIFAIGTGVNSSKLAMTIELGMITFGGLSINLQSLAYLSKCGVKAGKFLLLKVVQSVIAMIILYFVLTIINK